MASNTISLRRLDETCVLEVTVKVTREFRVRIWLALKLITFAWWVAGGRVEVKQEKE